MLSSGYGTQSSCGYLYETCTKLGLLSWMGWRLMRAHHSLKNYRQLMVARGVDIIFFSGTAIGKLPIT